MSEEFAGEEMAASSVLQTFNRYIVQEELQNEHQDNSQSLLTPSTSSLHGRVSVVVP